MDPTTATGVHSGSFGPESQKNAPEKFGTAPTSLLYDQENALRTSCPRDSVCYRPIL